MSLRADVIEANNSIFYNVAGNLIFNNYYSGEQSTDSLKRMKVLIILLSMSQIPAMREYSQSSIPSQGPSSVSTNVCKEHGPMLSR
jgi:hypothetical protein